MGNIYEELQKSAHTIAAVRAFGYGYLDQLLKSYSDELITEQIVRRQYYMLTVAVESRLLDLEREARRLELDRAMVARMTRSTETPAVFKTVQQEIEETDPEAVAETAVTEP